MIKILMCLFHRFYIPFDPYRNVFSKAELLDDSPLPSFFANKIILWMRHSGLNPIQYSLFVGWDFEAHLLRVKPFVNTWTLYRL
jgi:hypothetical protein